MNHEVLEMLPGFHALTGSDTTSYLAGHSKKTCQEVFKLHHSLLRGLGDSSVLSDKTIKDAEEFVCKVYGSVTAGSSNDVRVSMFVKGMTSDKLPPTSDALLHHIVLPPPETMGWKMEATSLLIPELCSLPPVPKACEELISCNTIQYNNSICRALFTKRPGALTETSTCSTGFRAKLCSCQKAKITRIASCKCRASGEPCRNIIFSQTVAMRIKITDVLVARTLFETIYRTVHMQWRVNLVSIYFLDNSIHLLNLT